MRFRNFFNFELLIGGLITFYVIIAATVSVNRYWQFQNYYFDLGIFDRAIWKVSNFEIPVVDHPVHFMGEQRIIFADHFNPSIFLFSPIYWIYSGQEVLLIAQAVVVGLAAGVGYVIARKIIKNKVAIFSLILAFLGYIGLQNALISDFHDATVVTLPLMIAFWAAINERWKIYFLSLLVILGFKESFAGLGVGLGAYLYFNDKKYYKQAIATILISLVWGYTAINYLIPFFAGKPYFYSSNNFPTNLVQFIKEFILPDTKFKTMFFTFLTFGFLPIFYKPLLPAIFENFMERFILAKEKKWDLGFHYNAPLSPLMFLGAANIFGKMEKGKFKVLVTPVAILIILIVIFLHRFYLRGPLQLFFNPVFYEQTQHVKYLEDFINEIPRGRKIMTQNDIGLRISREDMWLLRESYKPVDPDVVALNLTPGQSPTSFYPLNYESTIKLKEKLLMDDRYILKKNGELHLFVKK